MHLSFKTSSILNLVHVPEVGVSSQLGPLCVVHRISIGGAKVAGVGLRVFCFVLPFYDIYIQTPKGTCILSSPRHHQQASSLSC